MIALSSACKATKTLAKLANHIAKTADRKPGSYPAKLARVCNLSTLLPEEVDQLFAATDVGSVWGVGRRISEKLRAGGVHTVLDLVRKDAATLRAHFSVVLEKTLLELRGTSCMGGAGRTTWDCDPDLSSESHGASRCTSLSSRCRGRRCSH